MGRGARLDLTRFNPGLHLSGFSSGLYRSGLDLSRFPGGSRLHLARFGSRLYPRLDRRFDLAGQGGLYRINLLLRRQLLDLLLLLWGQLHGSLGRQTGTRDSPSHRLGRQGRGLGNLGRQWRHILRGMDDVGLAQVGPGHVDVGQPLGRRQPLALHQGRRVDLSDAGVAGEHIVGRPPCCGSW